MPGAFSRFCPPTLEHGGQWGPACQVCFRAEWTEQRHLRPQGQPPCDSVFIPLPGKPRCARGNCLPVAVACTLSALFANLLLRAAAASKPRHRVGWGFTPTALATTRVGSPYDSMLPEPRTWPAHIAKPGSSCVPPGTLPPSMEVAFPALSQAQSEHTGPCRGWEPFFLPRLHLPNTLTTNSIVVFHVLGGEVTGGKGCCDAPGPLLSDPRVGRRRRGAEWLEGAWGAAREAGLGVAQSGPRLSLQKGDIRSFS